ncbi:MAG TPA: alpha/beta hydrolase [Cellvibrio sp.]|nr:alpha/beta hydrolase [Cellvibrio sp.]
MIWLTYFWIGYLKEREVGLLKAKCFAMFLLVIGCAGCVENENVAVNAQPILKRCPGFTETGKPPLAYSAECGSVSVKENPADPESKEINIEILRLPAISPAAQKDPLFLIQGGPGGSSIEMANFLHGFFADVRKNRDLIFVDQRGTGKSNPLRCTQLSLEDIHLSEGEQIEKYLGLMKQCASDKKDSLPFYTTLHAVQDLDVVRKALGYEKINLWGTSYGTRVALEYAHQFPQHARTIILDAIAPKEIALSKFSARDSLAALAAVNAECLAQADCAKMFGDIVAKTETIYARLNVADQSGTPLIVSYGHPLNQVKDEFNLTARIFSQLIFSALYSRDLTVLLPQAISQAEQGNYELIATLFALSVEQSQKMNLADAMHFSVLCNEDWYFISANDVETTPPFFGLNAIKDRDAVCAFWPKANLPEEYYQPIHSEIPALLLSGKHDPITPEYWADQVARTLPNSTRLSAAGGNHGISMEGCLPQIIAQFIERGSMQDVKTECVSNIKPLPLVLGANQKKTSSANNSSVSNDGGQP